MTRPAVILLLSACAAAWAAAPPDEAALARFRRIEETRREDARASALWKSGKRQEAWKRWRAVLDERAKLYPTSTCPPVAERPSSGAAE